MGPSYFGMIRRAAVAWSDLLLGIDQRCLRARELILDKKGDGYGMRELMRDSVETWMAGMDAWEQTWMPWRAEAGGTPVILLRGKSLSGSASISNPVDQESLRWTMLVPLGGGGAPIMQHEVKVTIDGNGVLDVKVQPPAQPPGQTHYERHPGLYRRLVYAGDTGTPRVLAEIVVEIRSQTQQ